MLCVEVKSLLSPDASVQIVVLLNEVLQELSLETVFLGQYSYEIT